MPDIPPRRPIGDPFSGVLLRYATAAFLATAPHEHTEVIASGDFTVRYAVRYLEKPHLAIVPGLLAVDYGDFYNGEAMWEFMLTKTNAYPRAEVFGYRNDGKDDMIVLKRLDLDQPVQVLVYDAPGAAQPLASVDALLTPDTAGVAPRLLEHLPRYNTLDDWIHRERP
jgi:hypothetical protein